MCKDCEHGIEYHFDGENAEGCTVFVGRCKQYVDKPPIMLDLANRAGDALAKAAALIG